MRKFGGLILGIFLMFSVTGMANALTIFSDDFNRSNSNDVGNGWVENEGDFDDVAIWNNTLRLRDWQWIGNDAAAKQIDNLAGWTNIYLDFDWAASENTESSDKLYVSFKVGGGDWVKEWTQSLSGSGFASVSLGPISLVENQDIVKFKFHTDVSTSREYAQIDNVVLRGDQSGGAPVPEPATMMLFGLGLLGLAGVSRKKS